uniref:Uncharacterized protein n=1 Tax=Knipowitschia caucasica TaxID=637954 RepID=A0AAV2J4P4_KNICA
MGREGLRRLWSGYPMHIWAGPSPCTNSQASWSSGGLSFPGAGPSTQCRACHRGDTILPLTAIPVFLPAPSPPTIWPHPSPVLLCEDVGRSSRHHSFIAYRSFIQLG